MRNLAVPITYMLLCSEYSYRHALELSNFSLLLQEHFNG